jgi:hypothetical protein
LYKVDLIPLVALCGSFRSYPCTTILSTFFTSWKMPCLRHWCSCYVSRYKFKFHYANWYSNAVTWPQYPLCPMSTFSCLIRTLKKRKDEIETMFMYVCKNTFTNAGNFVPN